LALLCLLWTGVEASPAFADCGVTTPTSASLPSYSPAALAKGAVPYLATTGSFNCTAAGLLTLLSGDYLRVRLVTTAPLTLTSAGGTVTYQLAADAAGTAPFSTSATTSYYEGGLLSLLDTSKMAPSIFVKPASTGNVMPGTYRGSFKVRWSWSFCTQLGLLGACAVGKRDSGSAEAVVNLVLPVAGRPAGISLRNDTTWDPDSKVVSPKAVPGARLRVVMTVTNTDIVALDPDTLAVTYAIPKELRLALDGDGTGSGPVVQSMQGATPSALTLTYSAPGDRSDDVDFSVDGGTSWGATPVAGSLVSEPSVNAVRFRPKGSMAPSSSFSISIPYAIK
jgi:hypothetical protein